MQVLINALALESIQRYYRRCAVYGQNVHYHCKAVTFSVYKNAITALRCSMKLLFECFISPVDTLDALPQKYARPPIFVFSAWSWRQVLTNGLEPIERYHPTIR